MFGSQAGLLEGHLALITGSSSGIGAAIAVAFAKQGAKLIITAEPEQQDNLDQVIKNQEPRFTVGLSVRVRAGAAAARLVSGEEAALVCVLSLSASHHGSLRYQQLLDVMLVDGCNSTPTSRVCMLLYVANGSLKAF